MILPLLLFFATPADDVENALKRFTEALAVV
jgi:hypothetical protein